MYLKGYILNLNVSSERARRITRTSPFFFSGIVFAAKTTRGGCKASFFGHIPPVSESFA